MRLVDPENVPMVMADLPANRIVRFTDMGGGGFSSGPSAAGLALTNPWHIALDCSHRIYVADRDNNRIVRMNDTAGNGWVAYSGSGLQSLDFVRWCAPTAAVPSTTRCSSCCGEPFPTVLPLM